MWKVAFWKDAVERAVRTIAQVMAAMLISAGTDILDADWFAYFSAAGMAAMLSIFTSLASEMKTPDGTASMVSATPKSTGSR